MKKTMYVVLSIALVLSVVACGNLNKKLQSHEFESKEQVFAFQAMTSSAMLTENDIPAVVEDEGIPTNEDAVASIDPISSYLTLFEELLTVSPHLNLIVEDSDVEGYEVKQQFSSMAALGEQVTYVMYYNIINEERDDDDDEVEYTFKGILIQNEITYDIFGKREVEEDEEELEFITKLDDNNYVIVKYEIEDDETEFNYEVYENGNKVQEFKLEIETEDNELEIEVEFKRGNEYGKYKFKRDQEKGKDILSIEYETKIDGVSNKGKAKILIIINEETKELSYQVLKSEDIERNKN